MASRSSRTQQSASARMNEYFVLKDGIDREVITADICRYLGNDALVRPGNYEDPQTRQVKAGYFITAYRNLTTAMIADLKADSERWENERRQQQNASRGAPVNVEYRASTTHQSRQYYGPTPADTTQGAGGYAQASTGSQVYDNAPSYSNSIYGQQSAAYSTQTSGFPPTQGYSAAGYTQSPGFAPPVSDGHYYITGAHLAVDRDKRDGPPPSGNQPRTVQYTASTPSYQQGDSRTYYSQQPAVSTSQYPAQQPSDPFYGRVPNRSAPPVGHQYDNSPDPYDQGGYVSSNQGPVTSSSTTATSGSSRRDRDSDRDRDSGRHHRDRRR